MSLIGARAVQQSVILRHVKVWYDGRNSVGLGDNVREHVAPVPHPTGLGLAYGLYYVTRPWRVSCLDRI